MSSRLIYRMAMKLSDNMVQINSKNRVLLLCAALSLLALGAAKVFSPDASFGDRSVEVEAAATMERAISVVGQHLQSIGYQFDDAVDPNHTGLVGVEYSDITTTVGSLDAKRTTTNPNMASLLVRLLNEAGVVPGDTIAVGNSGSFPALTIATLAAAKAMNVHPVMILSLGASSYGATRLDFTVLEMVDLLRNKGIFDDRPIALSLGGAKDVGADLEPQIRDQLTDKIHKSGLQFILEPDLQLNVNQRMVVYFGPSSKRRIAVFVNIGGSYADLGTNPLVLKLEPGINKQIQVPSLEASHGVVFAMAKRHIPVIHLLHIKGLALKYGLPWDPVPLPKAGTPLGSLVEPKSTNSLMFITVAYFSLLVVVFVTQRKAFIRTSH